MSTHRDRSAQPASAHASDQRHVGPVRSAVRLLSGASIIRMNEAAALTGLTQRAIRFYEERGLIETRRGRNNVRLFDDSSRDRLLRIADLRRHGISIAEIADILDADDVGEGDGLVLEVLELRLSDAVRRVAELWAAIGRLKSSDA